MGRKTITRVDLYAAVYEKINLSRSESSAVVELVLKQISDTLANGETVKLSSFGSFSVRKKGQRIGRNPKTGTKFRYRRVALSCSRLLRPLSISSTEEG